MLEFDSFDYFQNLLAMSVVCVPLYHLLPWTRARRLLLGLVGMYLIFLIAPRLLVFYTLFWIAVFLLQFVVARIPESRWRLVAMWISVIAVVAPMVIWKVNPTRFIIEFNLRFNDLVQEASPWMGAVDRVRAIILPVGLSFATFRAVDLLVNVYLGITKPLSPTRMLAVGFFPSVQIIGPVIEHTEIGKELDEKRRIEPADIMSAVVDIASGLFKVFVISYLLKPSGDVLIQYDDIAWWKVWIELALFALYFYFNFAGFSDIAIGSARLFGFRLKPNFNRPYVRNNPQEFWNNWHMSLTRFAQRNVFVPLGGMRARRQYLAVFATIMVIALWHDITLALVLFGFYHAAGLIGHRLLASRRPPAEDPSLSLRLAKIGALFGFVALSFPMLLMHWTDLPDFYGRLVGVG